MASPVVKNKAPSLPFEWIFWGFWLASQSDEKEKASLDWEAYIGESVRKDKLLFSQPFGKSFPLCQACMRSEVTCPGFTMKAGADMAQGGRRSRNRDQ